ncbi:MAG: oligosaccharide flippase family protein [Nitrosomonadales bacterium]
MRFSNVNQLINSGLIYGLGGALNRALSFIALPFIARYIAPAEYGVISMLMMMGVVFTALFTLGLGTSIGSRYFSKETPFEKDAVIFGAHLVLLVSAAVLVVCGMLNAAAIGKWLFSGADHAYQVRLSILTAALGILVQPWQLKLQFEQKAKRFVVASFGSALLSFLLIIFFVVILEKSITGYLYALLLGQMITFTLFFMLAKNGMRYLPAKKDITVLLKEGIPLIPAFLFVFVIQNAARYPLQSYHGLTEVGIYTMGTSIGMGMGLFVEAFARAWAPFSLTYMNKQEEARQLLARLTQYYLVAFGYLTLLFFYFAKPVAMIVLPHAYEDAFHLIGLAAAAQFFLGLFTVLLPSLYFAKKLYIVTLLQGVAAILSVVMFVTIIPAFGALGAGLSVALSNLFLALLLLSWVRKDPACYKIDYQQRKIYKTLGWIALLALLPMLLSSESLLLNAGFAILCSVVSALIMFRLTEVSVSELRQAMRQLVQRS